MSQLSSLSFTSSTDSSLLVRDVAGSYRPAEPAEVTLPSKSGVLRAYSGRRVARQVMMPQARCSMAM